MFTGLLLVFGGADWARAGLERSRRSDRAHAVLASSCEGETELCSLVSEHADDCVGRGHSDWFVEAADDVVKFLTHGSCLPIRIRGAETPCMCSSFQCR